VALLRVREPAELADAPFTYPEVGATRDPELPGGYHHVERAAVVGSGRPAFERAAAAVFAWRAQRGAGLRPRATGPASEPGACVLLTAGLDRFGYDIPCRVVWADTAGDTRGFAYGTLPGHPESGEESFVVELRPGGEVVFTMRVFSTLALRLPRAVEPLGWRVQSFALGRYVAAVRRAAAG
jgi:uncharacterized protein (UPF0548 family)